MKAAVLHGPNDLRIDEVARPTAKPREALVRVRACALCTLEQRLFQGHQKLFYPIVAGHEAAGVVEEVGEGAMTSLRPGDRVALDLLNRCGECYYCRIGSDHLCENRFKKGLNLMGGLGEYVAVPTSQLFKIDAHLTFHEAALAEPLATCVHSLHSARPTVAEAVVILGAGVMGALHVLLCHALGLSSLVFDIDEKRAERTKEFGADAVLRPDADGNLKDAVQAETGGRGADVVILGTPAETAFQQALGIVRPGGRIVLFAASGTHDETTVSPDRLHGKEISLIGVQGRTSKDFQEAVALLNRRRVDVRALVSKVVPLEQVVEGMKWAMDRSTYRVVVEMDAGKPRKG